MKQRSEVKTKPKPNWTHIEVKHPYARAKQVNVVVDLPAWQEYILS